MIIERDTKWAAALPAIALLFVTFTACAITAANHFVQPRKQLPIRTFGRCEQRDYASGSLSARAEALLSAGQPRAASGLFSESFREACHPDGMLEAYLQYGAALARLGRLHDASKQWRIGAAIAAHQGLSEGAYAPFLKACQLNHLREGSRVLSQSFESPRFGLELINDDNLNSSKGFTLVAKALRDASEGRVDQARQELRQAIALEPAFPDPYFVLGVFNFSKRKVPAAIAMWIYALQIKPLEPPGPQRPVPAQLAALRALLSLNEFAK